MTEIFISHSSADSAWVEKLREELRSHAGLDTWVDRDSIQVGDKWRDALEEQLERAKVFVLVISPDYLASNWTAFELGVAMSRRSQREARVIPVVIRDVATDDLPFALRHRTLIDARGKSPSQTASLVADLLEPEGSTPGT